MRGPGNKFVITHGAPAIRIDTTQAVAAGTHCHRAIRRVGEASRDDVDHPGNRLSAIHHAVAAFQYFSALDHARWQRVGRTGGVKKSVVDAYAVDRPQDVTGT